MFDIKLKNIKPGPHYALDISLDTDEDDWENPVDTYPMFLFIPDVSQPDHYHIPLTKEEATALRDWLDDYLK